MAWKPFKKLRDYIPEDRRKEYDDINSGRAIGGLWYTLEFLNLVEEAKKEYNKEHIFKLEV